MNLPGFTAEGSLSRPVGRYRTSGAYGQVDGAVYPATVNTFVIPTCYKFCYDQCVSQKTGIEGWDYKSAQNYCSGTCDKQCTCAIYTDCSESPDGLCTTCTTSDSCGGATMTTDVCIPTPKKP